MKRTLLIAAVGVVGGILALNASSAHEGKVMHLPDSKDVIAMRHYLMENVGANAEELNKKLKAGNVAAAKVNAQAIALHSTRVVELFPKGSMSPTSRAKDEIWQKWDEFVKSSDAMKTESDQLAVLIAEGKNDEVAGQAKKMFGACKSCHDSFRKPEEKK